ncbi:glycosyltransferase [Collinsella sp. zg1085]|uniref:glycosyltransferase n=1 Tax=Collinsella sp. zg1085 TaxID=2844380 RepID=UPI001C0B2ADF|nr:glycosyltransferase [Collinsella sp. zg1085]QWT17567.1 glycosyltransferase [Collinsella sp. zg1085]
MNMERNESPCPLVSVIVPVYNSERYLPALLDSLQRQTYRELEIICVNDGSRDESLEILNERAAADSRIVVVDKENSGAASTRNVGIDLATGAYLCFVDSDDLVEPTAFERLVDAALAHQADAVIFDMDNFDDETGETSPTNAVFKEFVPARTVFRPVDIDNFFKRVVGFTVNKLYRTAYLKDLSLKFPLVGAHEDMPFTYIALSPAERLYYLDETLYHYRRARKGSLSDNTNDDYRFMLDALLAFRDGLRGRGLWVACERDFVNYALHMCHWKYTVLGKRDRWAFSGDLRARVFDLFEISQRDRDYFFDEEDAAFLERNARPGFAFRMVTWGCFTLQRLRRLLWDGRG